MTAEWSKLVGSFVAESLNRRLDVLEQACEQALQVGVCGVSVRTGWADDLSWFAEAWVDPTVPYGFIHDHDLDRRSVITVRIPGSPGPTT